MVRYGGPGFSIDVCWSGDLCAGGISEQVVDSPATIEFSRASAIAPPRVWSWSYTGLESDKVIPPSFEQFTDPLTLMGEEAGGVLVGFGVKNIVLGMRDIEIPTENGWYPGAEYRRGPIPEGMQPEVFLCLAVCSR